MIIGATAVTSSSTFGQGTGPITLDDLQCTGLEYRLIDCAHRGLGVHGCSHSEDVGVRCIAGKIFYYLLFLHAIDSFVIIQDVLKEKLDW